MKKIGTILVMILLLAGCNKGGVGEEKEQLGLGIDNIAGEWTTSDSSKNPWSAKKLSISYTGSQASNTVEVLTVDTEAPTTEMPTTEAPKGGELNEYENVGVPSGTNIEKSVSQKNNNDDDELSKKKKENELLAKKKKEDDELLYYLAKKKKTGGGSGSTETAPVIQPLLSLYVTTVKSDGSTGPLSNTSAAARESSSLIKLRLETTPEREDFYLIRKVSETTYLNICECESGECTDADHDRCYTYFKDIVDSNTPGAFKKGL